MTVPPPRTKDDPMTVSEFKRDLPSVPVRIGSKTHYAKASGRLCDDCTLTVFADTRKYLRGAPYEDRHFSWDAVTRAATTDRPLNWN